MPRGREPDEVRFPFAALADKLHKNESQAALELGVSGSTATEYRTRGVTVHVAERLAGKAGFHPYEVWPELRDHQIAAETRVCRECGERFAPHFKAPHAQFCQQPCRNRWHGREYQRRQAKDPAFLEAKRVRQAAYREEIRVAAARRAARRSPV